nr:hypothetical protein [Tanacetum cinerariifolium]
MSEEDQKVDVAALLKFDMPLYESEMTSKDVKSLAIRHAVTMSEYLRFPFFYDQTIPAKTDHQKRVKVEDPKIVATRERKARAAAKKREKKKRGADEGEGSRLKNLSEAAAETAESQEDRSLHIPPHDSANRSVHDDGGMRNEEETNSLQIGSFVDQSGRNLTIVQTEVFQSSLGDHCVHRSPSVERVASPTKFPLRGGSSRNQAYYVPEWSIFQRYRVDTPMWYRELMVHLPLPPHPLKRSRMPLPTQPPLRRPADRHKMVKSEHDGCARKLEVLENQNSKLSQVNKDQALRIRELENKLARKDSALVYAERINAERAQEKEKLVAQLSETKMENFDCIRKLLPTVFDRLFQSHEYKQSLSKPFNLAIQVGWAKGLVAECSEEDLLKLVNRIEGFDVYADKKMFVYPDSPPVEQAPPSKPSSGKAFSSSALNKP